MANLQMNIDKFLGINATGNDLKKGELANMQNFKIADGYDVKKRNGYTEVLNTALGKNIQGQWYGKIGATYWHLFACDGHVYANDGDGTVTNLGTLTDAPTNFFFFGEFVYILNGSGYYRWGGSGSIESVTGYVPIIAVGTLPAGGGTSYEPVNLLNAQRIQKFNGDGTATVYNLRDKHTYQVDSVEVGGVLISSTKYLVLQQSWGTVVYFNSDFIPATGVDNVVITYTNYARTEFFSGVTGSQTIRVSEGTNVVTVYDVVLNEKSIFADILFHPTDNVDDANNTITSTTSHNLYNNQGIKIGTGTLPTGVSSSTVYYAEVVSPTVFALRTTPGGSRVNIAPNGSGQTSFRKYDRSNFTNGYITIFTSIAGYNNIKITYGAYPPQMAFRFYYNNFNIYGGKNDNRVFLYGNANRIIYSDLANGVPSAEYFPALNFIDIGRSNESITHLSTQYDRQIIFKENSTHWCSYEYDTSLGVTFPTYPLNDNVGCTFLGTGQTIRNNPWFIYQKSIYEITSPYMRDERYVKYVSDKIQPLLDALTFTNVHTLDNEAEKEYWLCIGRNVFVWNHNLETWHRFYLADTVTSICKVGSAIVIGTTGGQLMTFDTSLTDNGTAIEGFIETHWLDYGTPQRNKYLDFVWATIDPEIATNLDLEYALNLDPTEYILAPVVLELGTKPITKRIRVKAKKFTHIKFTFNNNATGLRILSVAMPVTVAGQSR